MVIDGDVHQSSTITDTMIRGVHNIKILRSQCFGRFKSTDMLKICGIEGEIQFLFLMTPYPTCKIQFNKKRGAQTDPNSVLLSFYVFLNSASVGGYAQLLR